MRLPADWTAHDVPVSTVCRTEHRHPCEASQVVQRCLDCFVLACWQALREQALSDVNTGARTASAPGLWAAGMASSASAASAKPVSSSRSVSSLARRSSRSMAPRGFLPPAGPCLPGSPERRYSRWNACTDSLGSESWHGLPCSKKVSVHLLRRSGIL